MANNINLPEGYQRIEYLQSTGTQYIDTGLYGHMNHTYEVTFQQTTTKEVAMWGALGQTSYIGYNMSYTYGTNNGSRWCIRWESTKNGQRCVWLDVIDLNRHIIKTSKGSVYFDGVYRGKSSGNDNDFILEYNVYLFKPNRAGQSNASSDNIRIYSYKDYDENDNLILDLIPVRVGTTGYMYDTVSGELFGNAGTGEFILGPDIASSFDERFLNYTGLKRLISWIKGALNSKQDMLTFDSAPTASSTNPATSGGIATALNNKQDTLTFDTTPTTNSNNPVTSGGVKAAIDALGTPNEIASITTQESSASGGNNVVTITDTDGTVTSFNVKNGIDGQDGADGVSLGEIALVQTTGDSEESVMSQKTVTNELTAAQVVKPSYFTGLMLTYLLEDYPMFDIRKCDGVSIVMDAIQLNLGRSSANFVISNGTSTNANPAFYIYQSWGNLKVGLYRQYGGTAVQGMTVNNGNNAYFSHRVYTVDFLTGVCKVYKNGVLVNTLTPSSYDYSVLKDFFDNTATRLSIGPGTRNAQLKTSSMAVFGHVLTDDDVTDLYGNGSDSVCGNLIPDKWKANWLIPRIITNWGTQHYNATKTTHADGGAIFTTNSTSGALLRFGFTGIPTTGDNAVRGNIIYEWDFEVLSGSANANYSMRNGSYAYKSWKIIDSEGNELEDGTLVEVGNTYHVINKPDNLANDYYDSTGTSLHLGYVFDTPSSDFSIWVKPELKLTERGAAIVCGPDEYKDVYWEMPNGTRIPNNKTLNLWNILGHNTLPITQGVHYGGFKDKAVVYSSSKLPQFNGQIAVDTVNGKVYIGYLTSTGGTWKQVSN